MVGINAGRLPTKITTRHVKNPTLPEGATTTDGRIKVVDNNSGRAKYIDQKIGLALDSNGDLTHERF